MPRRAIVAFAAFALLPGCLTLYSKTEIVRGGEARRPIEFENPQAADAFQSACKGQGGHLGGTYFGVPFVTIFAKNHQLSEAALWNDAVIKCDTNQDGVITYIEAAVYAKSVGGKSDGCGPVEPAILWAGQ